MFNRKAEQQRPTGKKPYLLVLTSTFPRYSGDSEPPFVFELSRRLKDDFRVIVLAPHAPGIRDIERLSGIIVVRYRYFVERWEQLAYDGGILARLRYNRWLYALVPFLLLAQMLVVQRLLKRYDFAAIHAHWLIPQGFVAVLITLFFNKKPAILLTSHGGDLFGLRGFLFNIILGWVLQRSSAISTVSNAMRDEIIERWKVPKNKVVIIPMGVDIRKIFIPNLTTTRECNTLLFVGRLVKKKGVKYLLEAMAYVVKKYPKCRLLIVGSGPEAVAIKKYVENLHLDQQVTFLGRIENERLPTFYRSATIFVAPCVIAEGGDQEGLGLVLVEALACACPVITTDLPAIRDVVIHERTGVLVSERDSYSLANAILDLLNNPGKRKQLADKGREYVEEHFDWEKVTKSYAHLLKKLIHFHNVSD